MLSHPTGNANVRQAARALLDAGMLEAFHTTIAWRETVVLNRLLPGSLRAELLRRSYPGLPADLIHTHPWREALRLLAVRLGWRGLTRHESGRFSFDAIYTAMDRAVAAVLAVGKAPAALYTYDGCALESFRAARKRGVVCIYELPIGYLRRWKALRDEEMELEPLWGQTLRAGIDSEAKLIRKDEEITAADQVIVPSRFVAETLAGSPAKNISIVPYGCPELSTELPQRKNNEKLRVLFVGSIGQRKGISYLLRAMEMLRGRATLTLIGRCTHSSPELLAQLSTHTWTPSMPHSQVLEAMRQHDVLVLPTLFEGRALVVLEALAQGLPVITTLHSGAEDVVVDGVSGLMVPIRSADRIAAALTQLAEERELLEAMSEAARKKAAEWSWSHYRRLLLETVGKILPQG